MVASRAGPGAIEMIVLISFQFCFYLSFTCLPTRKRSDGEKHQMTGLNGLCLSIESLDKPLPVAPAPREDFKTFFGIIIKRAAKEIECAPAPPKDSCQGKVIVCALGPVLFETRSNSSYASQC